MGWPAGYIAVDWGTTNRRAYRLDGDGRVVDRFEDALGVTAVPAGGFARAAQEIRARLGEFPMLLAGMVGSNRGWREAAYVPCPADENSLAERIAWIEPGRTGIVPGVAQRGAAGADVMRGEEVQVFGALAQGLVPADGPICHPGTHAKWIGLANGRIVSFRTAMTGEIYNLVRRYSILADLLAGEARPDAAFDSGVDEALAGADLLSALFRIRARHLLGEGEGEPASYASGLLIGCDVRAGLLPSGGKAVALIGRPDLCALYAAALARAGRDTTIVDGAAAFVAGIHRLTELI